MTRIRKRILPEVRTRTLEQSLVKQIALGDNQQRAATVKDTEGEPLLNFEGCSNPYLEHQRNDLLLSIQHMRSEGHDEMVFMCITHCKELTFKAMHYELVNMQARINEDDVAGALQLVPRIRALLEYLVKTWDVLSTITPHEFNKFRNTLGVASGQQSYMYRHVEFILGNKSVALARAHANNPDVWPYMERALQSPSLYDDVLRLLQRRDIAIPPEALGRDWSETYQPNPAVEDAWLWVYGTPTVENDLYRLGEALLDLADVFSQYRWRHFVSVERILGFKPGTGGSAGVGWLRSVVDHRFFPELWSVRTKL